MGQIYSMTDKAAPTSTTAKTALRVAASANVPFKIIEWGVSFNDATAADLPFLVEELYESTVAAPTGTTGVAVDFQNQGGTSSVTLTNATRATVEGAATLAVLTALYLPSTATFVKQYPLGREPEVLISKAWRLRLTAPTSVPAATVYAIWEE